jgi:hypothetical protein
MVVGAIEAGRTHPLYRDLLADATFHQLLLACDADLADAARAGRCALCGGALLTSVPLLRFSVQGNSSAG